MFAFAPYGGTTASLRDQWPLGKKAKLNPPLSSKNRGLQNRRAIRGHWGARQVTAGTRKLSETRQFPEQISGRCSNGVPFRPPTKWSWSALQHQINFIIQDTSKVGQAAAGYQRTDDLQCLQTRISSITQDMNPLQGRCSAETQRASNQRLTTSNPEPDVRFKSKTWMRRQRRAQKYAPAHHQEMSSYAVITLNLSASLHPHVVVAQIWQHKMRDFSNANRPLILLDPLRVGNRRTTPRRIHENSAKEQLGTQDQPNSKERPHTRTLRAPSAHQRSR